jgi:DNA mismatch endonuclease (patch repair protein)
VDGCFWHCCPLHGSKPASNSTYWISKLARNRARDLAVTRELRLKGWRVLRIWEHALREPARVAMRCQRARMRPMSSPHVLLA